MRFEAMRLSPRRFRVLVHPEEQRPTAHPLVQHLEIDVFAQTLARHRTEQSIDKVVVTAEVSLGGRVLRTERQRDPAEARSGRLVVATAPEMVVADETQFLRVQRFDGVWPETAQVLQLRFPHANRAAEFLRAAGNGSKGRLGYNEEVRQQGTKVLTGRSR